MAWATDANIEICNEKHTHTYTRTYWQVCHGHSTVVCVCVCVNSTDTRVPTVLAVDAVAIKRRILNWRFEGQTNTLSTHAHTQSHTTTHTHTHTHTLGCAVIVLENSLAHAFMQDCNYDIKYLRGSIREKKVSRTNVNYTASGRGRVRERDRERDRQTVWHMCHYIV